MDHYSLPASTLAQDRESSPAETSILTAMLHAHVGDVGIILHPCTKLEDCRLSRSKDMTDFRSRGHGIKWPGNLGT